MTLAAAIPLLSACDASTAAAPTKTVYIQPDNIGRQQPFANTFIEYCDTLPKAGLSSGWCTCVYGQMSSMSSEDALIRMYDADKTGLFYDYANYGVTCQ